MVIKTKKMQRKITIGSRGSDLALWQAHHVQDRLRELGVETEILIIKTRGDKIQHLSFDKMEGKGFFTKEIEEALLNKSIDLAVHSHKDLETTSPDGLVIAAVSEREDPSELLLIRHEAVDDSMHYCLKEGAIVGTSSGRRKTQLLSFRDDIELKDLRGNVPTRIQKLRDGNYDAIMLARAGVERLKLDLSDLKVMVLDPREFVPAPAQGVLGLQIRETDAELFDVLQNMNDTEVQARIGIERKVLNLFQGGCQLPLGVYVEKTEDRFKVWASMATEWKEFPRRLYWDTTDVNELPQRIVNHLNKEQRPSVFVTRNLGEKSYLKTALEKSGMELTAKSLIKMEAVAFDNVPESDWIFFSSRNSVRFFMDNKVGKMPANIAAVGAATAAALRQNGVHPTFVGSGIDTEEIAVDFAKQLKSDEKVLFPCSKKSRRSVQQKLAAEQVIDLITYDTLDATVDSIPTADVVVFTSPSNAASYLQQTSLQENQTVIAMGKTTGRYLEEQGVSNYVLPWDTSELALADAITSL